MKKKKNLICYFKKGDAPGSLKLHTIDVKTKLKIDKHSFEILPENVLNFFINAPKFIKISAKAVIFNEIYDFENSSFQDSNEFIRIIFIRFEELNIPIRLIDGKTFTITRLLTAAKINPKLDRNILFILISDDTIFFEEIYRTKEGYSYPPTKKTQNIQSSDGYNPKKIKEKILSNISQKPYGILLSAINMIFLIFWIPILFYGYDPEKIKDEILEYLYPYKICIAEFSTLSKNFLDDMLNVFGVDKYLTVDEKNENETIAEIALQLFDNKHNQYYIIPRFSFIVSNTEYFGRIGFINIMSWNNNEGLYGEDLYISFDKEKPKFRNEAFKVLKEKPTFVVYDLLDILASKIDNFHTRPYWQFSITKDEENPILIEFDNFDGSRKHATPQFLIALLIKDHLKVIKEEIGEKPAEIGVVFVDKYKNEKYFNHSLLLGRIEESCNLLKINCKIVEI
uniref:Uncharacterized protein n=1 Tax=Panagrolaimus davidi TaxID=227884 RepID=A0A914PZ05_9BILA